jgi:hypothetical protein
MPQDVPCPLPPASWCRPSKPSSWALQAAAQAPAPCKASAAAHAAACTRAAPAGSQGPPPALNARPGPPPRVQNKADRALGWGGFDDEAADEEVTVVLHHVFDPDEFLADLSLATELEEDLKAECGKLGAVGGEPALGALPRAAVPRAGRRGAGCAALGPPGRACGVHGGSQGAGVLGRLSDTPGAQSARVARRWRGRRRPCPRHLPVSGCPAYHSGPGPCRAARHHRRRRPCCPSWLCLAAA